MTDHAVLNELASDVAALTAELTGGSTGAPAHTPIGALVRGLARRHRAHGAPLTVVCCDNMMDNGRVVERLVHGILDAVPGREAAVLRAWVQDAVFWHVYPLGFTGAPVSGAHPSRASCSPRCRTRERPRP